MEDEPSSTFSDLSLMMQKLGISSSGVSEDTDDGPAPSSDQPPSWRDADNDKLREEVEKEVEKEEPTPEDMPTSWKESTTSEKPAAEVATSQPADEILTYEQRAAKRRAEREKRKREREALASAK